jgi:hypothetical protein
MKVLPPSSGEKHGLLLFYRQNGGSDFLKNISVTVCQIIRRHISEDSARHNIYVLLLSKINEILSDICLQIA